MDPGADGTAVDVVTALAIALDADDFAGVESCLHPDVAYHIDGATHRGPAAVVASYRAGSELARSLFDRVGFDHHVVGPVDGGAIRVDFSDLLEVDGDVFEHHSVQDITVDEASGAIIAIDDRPVVGQRARLDGFMQRHDVRRP